MAKRTCHPLLAAHGTVIHPASEKTRAKPSTTHAACPATPPCLTLSLELGKDQRLTDSQAHALDRVPKAEDREVPRQRSGSPLLAQNLPLRRPLFVLEEVKNFPPVVCQVDVVGSCTNRSNVERDVRSETGVSCSRGPFQRISSAAGSGRRAERPAR